MRIQHPNDRLKIASDALRQFFLRSALLHGRSTSTSPITFHAGQRVPFVIEHPLNLEHRIHISLDIQPLIATAFLWFEEAKLRLPKP